MSFLSFNFALFVGLALLAFYFSPARWRPGVLLAFSYAFYLTWSVPHAVLLFAVTYGVFRTAIWIEDCGAERGKSAAMGAGVMALVVLLFGFKSVALVVKHFLTSGAAAANPAAFIIIPLGISYYVFKMIGYLLDVYWESIPAQRSLTAVALYGAFFPQIVSGPIQRAEPFFEQLTKIDRPDPDQFLIGLRRILFGLFKKIAIADPLGVLVQNVHSHPSDFSCLELLTAAYCFSIQLYADFSGITDIAIGVGLLFGIRGPENFDLPYLASNIQLFWRRMHMSLTSWLADYLFTPLRMSLRNLGTFGLCLAIFINTTAIGLWHGLTLTFLIFGAMHGVYVIVSVLTLKRRNLFFQSRPGLARCRLFVAPFLTFHLVVFSHIFFRAPNLPSALQFIKGLIPGWRSVAIPALRFDQALLGISARRVAVCLALFLASEVVTWAARRQFWVDWYFSRPALFRRAVYSGLTLAVLFLFNGSMTFIYANF